MSDRPKQRKKPTLSQYWLVFVSIIIGIGIGLAVKPQTAQLSLASAAEKEQARHDITTAFLHDNSINCNDPSDPVKPQDRLAVFISYFKVNGYANRAVIRGCNNIDRLLAKDQHGKWVLTEVNIALDARANPQWQKECLIQDITTADTEVRPENSSIDSTNLELCNKL